MELNIEMPEIETGQDVVAVSLDYQHFKRKPTKNQTAIISKRLAGQQVSLPIEQMAAALLCGQTISPSTFSGDKRTNDGWQQQQGFFIDVDKKLSYKDAISRCERFDVIPVFGYATFSAVHDERFRLCFMMPQPVTDRVQRKFIIDALLTLFPEADKACRDFARLFYGGKRLLYESFDARISFEGLHRAAYEFLYITNRSNLNRQMRKLGGVAAINSSVDGGSLPFPFSQIEGKSTHPIDNINGCVGISSNIENEPSSHTETTAPLRRFDWDLLEERCRLYREFANNDCWLEHNVRFGISLNLLHVEGGKARMMQGLRAREDYDLPRWEADWPYNKAQRYRAQDCDGFCPYADECDHSKNMLETTKIQRGTVQVLKQPVLRPLVQVQFELREVVARLSSLTEPGITVLKAPLGIGKTTSYLGVEGRIIACPTHDLVQEVAESMRMAGNSEIIVAPDIADLDAYGKAEVMRLHSCGVHHLASAYIHTLADAGNKEAQAYLDTLDEISCNTTKTVIVTHARLLHLDSPIDRVIIDEDPSGTLLCQGSCTMADLYAMAAAASRGHNNGVIKALIDYVDASDEGRVWPMRVRVIERTSIERMVADTNNIQSNVLDFLNCGFFIKKAYQGEIVISYIVRQELPRGKNIVIMSGTTDRRFCELLYGNQLKEFIDLGEVEQKGNIVQYPQYSFSRHSMRTNPNRIPLAKGIVSKSSAQHTITYASFEQEFNTNLHFGALQGINRITGDDLVIVGTPNLNPETYLLTACALGVIKANPSAEQFKMSYQEVNTGNFKFWFQTFDNEDLQAVQFHLVEEGLLQAIGRARTLRNECTVTVLSNFPIRGARIKYLDAREEPCLVVIGIIIQRGFPNWKEYMTRLVAEMLHLNWGVYLNSLKAA